MKLRLFIISLLLSQNSFAHIDCLIADVKDQVAFLKQNVNLFSTHRVTITNTLGKTATYKYSFNICATDQVCQGYNKVKTLMPGENFTDIKNITLNASYHILGNRIISAYTKVEGAEDGYIDHQALLTIISW